MMPIRFEFLPTVVVVVVACCWLVFGGALVYRALNSSVSHRRRDRASLFGLALQLAGIALVCFVHRSHFTPLARTNQVTEIALALLAVLSGVVSACMGFAAVRVLGRQWSLTARVLETHELITVGPYGLVRHPIYTALLGMILATGLAVSYGFILLLALTLYWFGTRIRIESEERLLKAEFGARFDEFARRVPALIPRFF
jgi:protein-S-isoprenylcysteine O-methyltransferase Ste14